jgi:hypothetical protein
VRLFLQSLGLFEVCWAVEVGLTASDSVSAVQIRNHRDVLVDKFALMEKEVRTLLFSFFSVLIFCMTGA